MLRYIIVIAVVFSFIQKNIAQKELKTLRVAELLQLVKKHHPIAKQSDFNIAKSEADILISKAAFDPIARHYSAQKTFGTESYYQYSNSEIEVPTWFGIEVYGGLEQLNGARFDPSETKGQTSYLGLSIPLAKDLVIDKRRAYLQQAKIYKSMAEIEQRLIINDLLMDAVEDYWQWVKSYQLFLTVKNNVLLNEKRVEMVRLSHKNGERPAIDTVEARAQLQSFQYQQNSNWLAFQNAGLALSAFLWTADGQPYTLPEDVVPQQDWDNEIAMQNFNLVLGDLMTLAAENHPYLAIFNKKLAILDIDKKLKFQELLPKIDFRYNQLGKDYNLLKTATTGPLFENNYQYGLKFEMPLRLSQGRGEFQKAKLKIAETRLAQDQKKLAIDLKIKSYFNEFQTLRTQIALQSNNVNNYQQLVKAEETRLTNGESTLFLVNSRESKALEAQEKLIELKTKYYKTIYALQWSAGLLK
jgi:outer membrane protein TolC